MLEINLSTLLIVIAISFVVALAALWLIARTVLNNEKSTYDLMIESDSQTAFLFDNETLVDATKSGRELLGPKSDDTTDWHRLITALEGQFSSLSEDLNELGDAGTLTILPDDQTSTARVEAEWWDGLARIVVITHASHGELAIDDIGLAALNTELDTLRQTAKLAPYLVWQETPTGEIEWANAAYLSLVKDTLPDSHNNSWPPARLFNHPVVAHHSATPKSVRVSLENKFTEETFWFDLTSKKVNESTLSFATPADSIVKAETSLNGFVQTLTKTFAHLSIGLAIFDRDRQLAIFNPALTDLTKMPFAFLSSRPTLYTMLDRLRENRMMPEPKDYKSWRHQMSALEEAAADGTYEETWTLPTGQTYRVIGRPHADGAVALLFEDISAEISLTRNFREELETGQAVLDVLQDAIVVFSSTGMITVSNEAYTDLWGVDPSTAFGEMCISDAINAWENICDPSPVWNKISTFISTSSGRTEWTSTVMLDTGKPLKCRVSPLAGGSTMVSFSPLKQDIKTGVTRQKSTPSKIL